jgi:hypothetical protein
LYGRTSESSGDFLRFASPEIAHLVWTSEGEVQLLHHFHHDANDGLNDGSDELWALMGGGDFAIPMVVSKERLHGRQLGIETDWSKIPLWNFTRRVQELARHALEGRKPERRTNEHAPRKKVRRAGRALQSASKKASGKISSRGRTFKPKAKPDCVDGPSDNSEDEDNDKVTVVGVTIPNTIPVHGFVVAVI